MHRLGTLVPKLALCAVACSPAREPAPAWPRAETVRSEYLASLDSLSAAVAALDTAAVKASDSPASHARLRTGFVSARAAYKRSEAFIEYFSPVTAEAVNGPALPEIEPDDPSQTLVPPEGFQVVEEYLYPDVDPRQHAALRSSVRVLRAHLGRARAIAAATRFTDEHVFDALRLELARVVTLGLAGFDSPLAGEGIVEAAHAMAGIRAALVPYLPDLHRADASLARSLTERLDRSQSDLLAQPDFERFDRLSFLVQHANPLAEALHRSRTALGIALPDGPRPWSGTAATLFDRAAWDVWAYAPAGSTPRSGLAALGERLFFDPLLSEDSSRSCAFCHHPEHAFTDRLRRSIAVGRPPEPLRNAPSLVNSALQAALFSDVRVTFLEDQVTEVVGNRHEMNGSLRAAAGKLRGHQGYSAAFAKAFEASPPGGMSEEGIRTAIAAYIRSLVRLDAPFDRYLRGDTAALESAARQGFNVFMGKGKCGTCHFVPLFGGTVPPTYLRTELEVLGVPSRPDTAGATVDPDPGAYRTTRSVLHRHAFKTPSLRNVAVTAPYMHNGVYRTLEEVIDFYDRGGGAGIGVELPNQTLPPDRLRLTEGEKSDLVAFMRALTDTSGLGRRSAGEVGGGAGPLASRP